MLMQFQIAKMIEREDWIAIRPDDGCFPRIIGEVDAWIKAGRNGPFPDPEPLTFGE